MFVLMNRTVGCMPDSAHEYESAESAVEEAVVTFGDALSVDECDDMVVDLWDYGLHYFTDPAAAGADYVSLSVALDKDNPVA
jgi:hypothetical protein